MIIFIEKERYKPFLRPVCRMTGLFGITGEELCCLRENRRREDEAYEVISGY